MPTVYDQQKTTYSDTNSQVRVIADVIKIIDPVDTPLIVSLGGLDGARGKLAIRPDGKKIELLEDEFGATADAFGSTLTSTDGTQATVVDGSKFQAGMIISFGTEYAWVSAVSGNDLTLTRGYGGTQDTAATAEAISIVGMARLEGDDADYVGLNAIAVPYNFTQIFQKALNVSGTDEAIDYYGMGSPFAYQAQKAVPELARLVELNLFHGQVATGSATTPRGFGGLPYFVNATNSPDIGVDGAVAKSDIDGVMELIHTEGGMPDLLVVHPGIANDLKDLIDTSSYVRVDQSENKLGLGPLMYADSQYGRLRIIMDRWCPVATAYALDSRRAGLYTLRPFGWKPLAVTGDSKKGEVVGEFSFMVANAKGHGVLTGITHTTPS
jgi:hypothetical protein